ncbi:MHYT domain-containing protein [Streptomyces sp. CC228A]|uniref:MHYT domain-containing protein n=1 Tax=Streptomyces sp. CC228A TaxID=2898186 RepID=UPI001F32287D|nr:MHYT domain-containing protein [Streptomyces sp. CC228A]
MGHLDHAAFGWLTPALSYAMACAGAALGLRCTVRALDSSGSARRNWLLTGASAIGTGIWTMHFIAMLGFTVVGTDIRYDVPLTLFSLAVAVLVVGTGAFAVGHGHGRPVEAPRSAGPPAAGTADRATARSRRDHRMSLAVGGLTTGLGVAGMHYLGMAALRLHGAVHYDPLLVALSLAIAVVAATAALWAALNIRTPAAVTVASLVMGAAVSSMHYTGMAAVTVEVSPSAEPLPGATAMQFIFPLAVGLGAFLFITSAFVALSPTADPHAARGPSHRYAGPDPAPGPPPPGTTGPPPGTTGPPPRERRPRERHPLSQP